MHNGLAVTGFDFEDQAKLTAPQQVADAGQTVAVNGRPRSGPSWSPSPASRGLADFLADLDNGVHLSKATLYGQEVTAAGKIEAYALTVADALVTRVAKTPDGYTVTLAPTQETVSRSAVGPAGTPINTPQAGFDIHRRQRQPRSGDGPSRSGHADARALLRRHRRDRGRQHHPSGRLRAFRRRHLHRRRDHRLPGRREPQPRHR